MEEIEQHNKIRAKEIIDAMFDVKIFADRITRNDMDGFEELIAYEFQCHQNSARKIAKFTEAWKLRKELQPIEAGVKRV